MPGVYEVADENREVIYIGQSARDVPNRLRQHLTSNECVRLRGCYWRYEYSRVPQAAEAELLERHRQLHGDLPLCNRSKTRIRDAVRRYSERSSSD